MLQQSASSRWRWFHKVSCRVDSGRWLTALLFACAITQGFIPTRVHADDSPPASPASLFSEDALGYLELSGLDEPISRVQNSEYLQAFLASNQFQRLQESPQFRKGDAGRKIIEVQLGMDLWTATRELLGHQVAVAMFPPKDAKEPEIVGYLRVKEAATLTELRDRLEPLLTLSDQSVERSKTEDGVSLLTFAGKIFFAHKGTWLVISNSQERLKTTLALIAGKEGKSLAQTDSFQQMTQQMGASHQARIFVNTGAITQTKPRFGAPEKMDNPLGSLLFAGLVEMAVRSPYTGIALDFHEQQFSISTGMAGSLETLGAPFQPFFAPAEAGTKPIPQIPDLIGGFTLYRDFTEWYAQREELLQDRVLPGFDKFETGLANLLPGKNFGADVLPLIGNSFTFLAARQDYKHLDGKPGVQLPGFAIIVDLAKPQEGEEILLLFFQTISSVLNLEAGKQGRQPWILETNSHNDVQIRYGRYLQKPQGDRLPFVFNFMPASARVGNRLIISSSIDVCEKVVDELQKPASTQVTDKNMHLEFWFAPFANLLEANQDFFLAQRIQQGVTEERATEEVTALLRLLRYFKSLDLNSRVNKTGLQLQLKGVWQ